jgi:hypothetical protein
LCNRFATHNHDHDNYPHLFTSGISTSSSKNTYTTKVKFPPGEMVSPAGCTALAVKAKDRACSRRRTGGCTSLNAWTTASTALSTADDAKTSQRVTAPTDNDIWVRQQEGNTTKKRCNGQAQQATQQQHPAPALCARVVRGASARECVGESPTPHKSKRVQAGSRSPHAHPASGSPRFRPRTQR